MTSTVKKTLALAALCSLVLANGFHVVALQSIGYLRMFSEYQKVMPASEAFELTFSGKEICGICAAVDEIQAEIDDTFSDFVQKDSQTLLAITFVEASPSRPNVSHLKRYIMPERQPQETVYTIDTPPPRG